MYEDILISAELILIAGDTLYSFLGGTLSEYFHCRPNDFLKIEVMKWARENGYRYYLLGGGRSDNDSLYQYKKSFFPKDIDTIFYTGRRIVNKEIYEKLDTIMKSDVITEESRTQVTHQNLNFFPAYRQSIKNVKKQVVIMFL